MTQKLLGAIFAIITFSGAVHLAAAPAEAADFNCWDQANALHATMSAFCGSEASCKFTCSNDFQTVTKMECSCVSAPPEHEPTGL